MSYSENAFARASRNTPVRDELVVHLDDIVPELKSASGISIVKHTKRGQSENRRLRFDTDVATLEVFRTSTSYLNRKILTRTYNLSLLEEVGPATSVPGGLPAAPGRTLVFVFRNRSLYVTVTSRDVCAALVALFRPAGGPLSHASPPGGGGGGGAGHGGLAARDGEGSMRMFRYESPSSPSSGPSVWGRRPHGRRVSEAAASTRSLENSAMSVSVRNFNAGGGRGAKGGDDGSGQGNGYDGGGAGRRRASHQGMILKRSASYTAGPDSFDMDHGMSTSSSDDDERIVMASMQSRHNSQSAETPPLSGTSGRSPMSTRSSESPDSVMRARMVGFGSADLGMDAKPNKRTGRSSSFKAPWARFTEGDKKGASSSSSSSLPSTRVKSAGLAVEDKAPIADAGQSAGDVDPPAVDRPVEFNDSAAPATAPHHGRNSKSPLAVRVEDRLNVESLRRPASAPTGVIAAAAVSETRRNVQGGHDEAGAGHRPKWKTAATSPSEQQRWQENKTASPPTSGAGGAPETGSARVGASQQQIPSAVPLDGEGEIAFAFSARPGSPARRPMARTPAGWKEHGDQKALTVRVASERKIPPLPRPLPNGQPWVAPKGVVGADEPIYQDSSSESSASPPPSRYGVANGARTAVAGARRAIPPALELGQSSSVDSLEDGGAYHQAQMKPGAVDASASYSEDEGEGETVPGLVLSPAYRNGRVPARDGGATPSDRGRSTRPRDLKGDHGKPPPIAEGKSTVETISTPQSLEAFSTPRSRDDGALSVEARHATVEPVTSRVGNSPGQVARTIEHLVVAETSDSFGPPTFEDVVSGLTIETASSHEYVAPSDAGMAVRPDFLPFSSMLGPAFTRRGSRGSRGSYDRRGSGGTDCTSPDSPPGGAVGEVRAVSNPSSGRPTPLVKSLHVNRSEPEQPQGPSGFEELWTVLEPAWGINSSFGMSMTPKVVLLGEIYKQMRNFQAAVASVCVRACGPALGEVCGRCGRAWAVLTSASPQSIAEFKALHDIANGISQLINVVERYEATAVVRRFTLSLIGAPTPWAELLTAGEGGDLRAPCQQIENAIALLPVEGGRDGDRQSLGGGGSGKGGKWEPKSGDLRLPPCPSYWAKGQFDQLTPAGLSDVLTLLHEPARFGELAQLVTRASDAGPANVEYSLAWDCVRQMEGPALGRQLRRAVSATLVAAGELLPLPRVPPPPPAYVPREWLTEQIEATILHPFLPLGIAGIGGASGSGKTVLAAAVVRDATVRCRFGDRVFWLHAGKGAHRRLMSLLQALADTIYAWLTNSDRGGSKRGCSGSGRGGSGGDAARSFDLNLREPVRFRDPTQAVNYVADLCRSPLLAGLRCLVVLDDVHERSVVDAIWKSGCQLLITSPVQGLLQAVGAEATIAEPLSADVSRHVAAGAAGEDSLCEEASRLVNLCRGCPLALAMSGAIAQAVLSAGTETREWRKPRTTPKKTSNGDDMTQGGGGGGGLIGSGWSLGIGSTFSNLTAPVGAWVEQVVVGTTSPPQMKQRAKPNDAPSEGSGAVNVGQGRRNAADVNGGGSAEEAASPQLSMEAMAWTQLTERVDRALTALHHNPILRQMLAEGDVEKELPVREMIAVLTQVALVEADRILGGSGLAIECYLSFALLPEGMPLPPPALEEFWQTGEPPGSGIHASSVFAETQRSPGPVEVLEALRMVGRAGGGEGADGLIPHGLQRFVVLAMAREQPEMVAEMVERRVRILSRVSSLVGTFDDDCWALGGGRSGEKNERLAAAARNRSGGGKGGSSDRRNREEGRKESEGGNSVIPTGLLGSGRPGRPSHGYGGFSRYDHLVASWDVLPADRSLTGAAAGYLSGVREACSRAATRQSSGGVTGGGWAAARALASAADLQALAGQGSEAIPAYGEACALLRAEAKRSAEISGIPRWQRTAKIALHKVACMVEELAVLAAQLGKEAPAIRLLQRAVEMHLSVLEASGALVPGEASVESSRPTHRNNTADPAREVAAQEAARGRGGGITYRAVADDDRPISSRLRFHRPTAGPVEPSASGRGGGGWGGGGGGGGTLPAFGRLDVAATCVEDLGLVVSCTRQLQNAKRSDDAVLLAEKLYPILKEILGADHAFTAAALTGLAGQVIVDECWSQSADTAGALGQHLTLPSPTSRRRLARNYEGRGAASGAGGGSRGGGGAGGSGGGGGGGGGSGTGPNKKGGSAEASTLAELSMPPFPLPHEFYTRYTDSMSDPPQDQAARTPVALGGRPFTGGNGWHGIRGCSSGFSAMNDGSTSSGTEGDGGSDSDGAPRGGGPGGTRRAGRVGRGGDANSGGVALPGRSYDRPPYGSQVDSQGWQLAGGSTTGGGRGAAEPASTRMQQELYFRHRTRRARAHAFLITAAIRAKLKNAVRAEAGLYLVDRARRAGASVPGGAGGLVSPDGGGTQMAKMTALTRRR